MFTSENEEFTITGNNEVAQILSRLSSDYIYVATVNSLNKERLREYISPSPNMVSSYELTLMNTKEKFSYFSKEILDKREEVYTQIIKLICDFYMVQFDDNESTDLYSSSALLYNFFISEFQYNIIKFFTNFIIKEKTTIYDMLNFAELKKSKDVSSIYNKKIHKNVRLAIIVSNLEYAIDNISTFDITFETYVNNVYQHDKHIAKHLINTVTPLNDFFKEIIVPLFQTKYRSILITNIKLAIFEAIKELEINNNNINIIKEED